MTAPKPVAPVEAWAVVYDDGGPVVLVHSAEAAARATDYAEQHGHARPTTAHLVEAGAPEDAAALRAEAAERLCVSLLDLASWLDERCGHPSIPSRFGLLPDGSVPPRWRAEVEVMRARGKR